MQDINIQYNNLIFDIMRYGAFSENKRTGSGVLTKQGAAFISLDLSSNLLPMPFNRAYYPRVAAAEVAWHFMGTRDPTFIMEHAPKIWQDFIEDGQIKAAYGYRWRKAFGRDQLAQAITALHDDPSTRQVYISSWDAAADGLCHAHQPLNIPCLVGFHLSLVDNRLHTSVFMRSSNVMVGLPYDIMSYALIASAIASTLQRKLGTLSFTLANAHIYETHFSEANYTINTEWNANPEDYQVRMPEYYGVRNIAISPASYVEEVKRLYNKVKIKSQHKPDMKVVI